MNSRDSMRKVRSRRRGAAQRGVVLVVALIFMTILFLIGAVTIGTTQSTEAIAGAVRTNELAVQSAEIALRHCEQSLVEVIKVAKGGPSSYPTTFTLQNILPRAQADVWQSPDTWDSASSPSYVLPLAMLNQSGLQYAAYKRPPECMVAPVPTVLSGGSTLTDTATFVVTARGFGPEVSALPSGATSRRPDGTEVWLQTHVTLD